MSVTSSPVPNSSRPRRRTSGVVVPHQPKWYQRLVAWVIFAAIRTVAATLRYRWIDRTGYLTGPVAPGPVR